MAKTAKTVFESDLQTFKTLMVTISATKSRKEIINELKKAGDVFTNSLAIVSSERKYLEIKKPLTALNNTVLGLHRGVEEKAINYSNVKRSLKNAEEKFYTALCTNIEQVDRRELEKNHEAELALAAEQKEQNQENVTKAATDATKSFTNLSAKSLEHQLGMWKDLEKDKLAELENNKNESPAIRAKDEKLSKIIEGWAIKRKELPKQVKNGLYGLVRMPVFARFKSYAVTKSSNLTSLGIRHVIFGEGDADVNSYPVLVDQTLLYFSKKDLKKNASNMTPVQFAQQMLDTQNSRQPTKYTLVTENFRTCPDQTDLLMFWIMPLKQFNALTARQHSGSSKKTPSAEVDEWDLPFDRVK